MKIIAVIPARLNSTRLPNKLLRDICGKTLIRRTYEATKNSSLFDEVLVVTNSEEILKELKNNQIKFLFDKNQYETGTDRIAGIASDINADIIINVQGDEPFINAKTIKLIKEQNKKVGISLKPKSKINLIEDYISEIDLVLIMSVEPGFGGQKFMPEVLEKTKAVRNLINKNNLDVDVEIDGGINFENCSKVKDAGANIIVSGSTIFKENKGDLKKNIEILRNN